MCGIIGYTGEEQAAPILIEGLKNLEYRGYDSAGMAVYDGHALRVAKDGNNLYPRDHKPYNVSGQSAQPFYPVQEWLDMEGDLTGVYRTFWGDKMNLDAEEDK